MRDAFKGTVEPVRGRDEIPIHDGDECLIYYPSNREINNKHGIAKIIRNVEAPTRVLISFEKGGSTLLTPNDLSLIRTAQEIAEGPVTLSRRTTSKDLAEAEIRARLREQELPRLIGVN